MGTMNSPKQTETIERLLLAEHDRAKGAKVAGEALPRRVQEYKPALRNTAAHP